VMVAVLYTNRQNSKFNFLLFTPMTLHWAHLGHFSINYETESPRECEFNDGSHAMLFSRSAASHRRGCRWWQDDQPCLVLIRKVDDARQLNAVLSSIQERAGNKMDTGNSF